MKGKNCAFVNVQIFLFIITVSYVFIFIKQEVGEKQTG